MIHRTIHEWESVPVEGPDGNRNGFTRPQADALLAAAREHPLANEHGTNILIDRHDRLVAQQMVGMLACGGCSLEILPKVEPSLADSGQAVENVDTVRTRLIRMLDVALDLKLALGEAADIARQPDTLLEVLIRAFSDKLLAEVRRGLPRRYIGCEDDLSALRGRLDVRRQFTVNAVRPDRLACRFDELDADTPLMRIMAAAVVFLAKHTRHPETQRKLVELRHAFASLSLVPVSRLPWKAVRFDRTNRSWESLFTIARMLLRRDWQSTHHAVAAPQGMTLLFPMNDLFEAYIAAQLRRVLAGSGVEVAAQGGRLNCLGNWTGEHLPSGNLFMTKPDIILRRGCEVLGIIDTKWKKLAANPADRKHGVSQSDIYQMMAYARLYDCRELMLLYPDIPNQTRDIVNFGIVGGAERLSIGTVDVALNEIVLQTRLRHLLQSSIFELQMLVN